MIRFKHIGLYVNDLKKMTEFYKNVFDLHLICDDSEDKGDFLSLLSGEKDIIIGITKLITERGKITQEGEMIELIQVKNKDCGSICTDSIMSVGIMHIGMGVDDIFVSRDRIMENGGAIMVEPFLRENKNWLCFAKDPEGNWIEVIQNG